MRALLLAVLIWGILFVGCSSSCVHPEITVSEHPDRLSGPAGRMTLKCGEKTWHVDLAWAPAECLSTFAKCMTPPEGWKPGQPIPEGWESGCDR